MHNHRICLVRLELEDGRVVEIVEVRLEVLVVERILPGPNEMLLTDFALALQLELELRVGVNHAV